MTDSFPVVRVTRKGADRVASGHPWIFASDVADAGSAQPGDAVRVVDPRNRTLGTAHYSSTSQIRLRLLGRNLAALDRDFFAARLRAAQSHRERFVHHTNAYRLVHGEADLLPGLVIDRYADCIALQTLSQGMDRALPVILDCLNEMFSPRAVVARNDAAVRERENLPVEVKVVAGDLDAPVAIEMNGLKLEADLLHGQKTGIFLDQRENYRSIPGGGNALDCFTCTGGFALHLARNCEKVEAVDSSALALATARRNAAANGIGNVEFLEADVFDLLTRYAAGHRKFSTVVLDPPAFAKSRSALEGALRGYREINQRALRLLEPGGILVTCSCSHHLSEAALLEVVAQAALDTGRTLRVLDRRTQAPDHPVLLTVPETHYLKCLILQVV